MQERHGASDESKEEPCFNIIERVIPLMHEMLRQAGYQGPPLFPFLESPPLPPWVICICGQLAKTIFKKTGKLKMGKQLDFYLIGKLVGVVLRMGQFAAVEMPREIEALKLDALPKDKQERIEKALDLSPVRPSLLAAAKAAPDTIQSNEELLGNAFGAMAEGLLQQVMTLVLASLQQPPNVTFEFLRGLPDGYTMFLRENGEFTGDRGRTNDYIALLAFWPDIEALRDSDGVTREQLYELLCRWDDTLLRNEPVRFDHLCEEIGLALKKPGPPRKA